MLSLWALLSTATYTAPLIINFLQVVKFQMLLGGFSNFIYFI